MTHAPLPFLGQVPPSGPALPPPPTESREGAPPASGIEVVPGTGGMPVQDILGIAGLVLLAALMLLALRKVLSRRKGLPAEKEEAAPGEAPPALPGAPPRVELPQTQAEQARLAEAQAAQGRAQALAREREERAREARSARDATERLRLEAEARALKEREEEAKREEFRARKAAEQEARERHRREREEAARLEAQAAALAEAEAAAERERQQAAARARVEAEAGHTLAYGLDKTRTQGFMARLNGLFGSARKVDESVLVELEEILFSADIGVNTASRLVESARERLRRNELSDVERIKALIREEVERIVDLPMPATLQGGGPPHVVMVVGVNGAGKTTTIGKLAHKLTSAGKTVVVAAGDTFRAAATEQLDVWAGRARAELVKGPEGSDPGSVAFEAVKRAREGGLDAVLCDTAGRLHTKGPLMEELRKVKRVMGKALDGAPHAVLLVLDATNGQNAIQQAKQFHEAVGITAVALTKLDGTAKGGVIIGICDELKLPVAWVGVGEKVADLRPFEPREFVRALFD